VPPGIGRHDQPRARRSAAVNADLFSAEIPSGPDAVTDAMLAGSSIAADAATNAMLVGWVGDAPHAAANNAATPNRVAISRLTRMIPPRFDNAAPATWSIGAVEGAHRRNA
jgi:hypothetical protein